MRVSITGPSPQVTPLTEEKYTLDPSLGGNKCALVYTRNVPQAKFARLYPKRMRWD